MIEYLEIHLSKKNYNNHLKRIDYINEYLQNYEKQGYNIISVSLCITSDNYIYCITIK